jgi:hypothetical protein
MTAFHSRRLGLVAAIAVGLAPLLFAADKGKPESKTQFYFGKVAPLKELGGAKDAVGLALSCDDGKVYPLLKDAGSSMFFTDTTLLRRPMRLTAHLVGDPPQLQVFQVHSLIKGELHEVYYWCDICAIKRFEKRLCECCGGPMELHEEKVKK